jgi:hypothetical protein
MAAENDAPEIPEWIYPDATVIVFVANRDRHNKPVYYRGTVGKVAKQSFVVNFTRNGVEGNERFNLKSLCSKDFGSTWHRWHYELVQPGSIEARDLEARRDRIRSRDAARHAMRVLIERSDDTKMDDLDLLREAIKALASHADLVLTQNNEED